VDHSETPVPDLIDQIYRLQASLSILAEQLARQPSEKEALQTKALDYLYVTNWYLENQMNTRRH